MTGNTELLNYIFQNSQMGKETIEQLLGIVKEKKVLDHMQIQLVEYQDLNNSARKMLHETGCEEKDIHAMAKISAYMSISIKTLKNKSPSHIAEMMIEGSTMGVIEATKNINHYKDADKKIITLAEKLLKTEESNIEHWKKFL